MPTGRITIVDAMQQNAVLGGIVDEYNKSYPASTQFPAVRLASGLKYSSQFLVELPKVGFRLPGDGIDASKARYEEREFKCYLFGGRVEVDKAAGQANSGGIMDLKARNIRAVTLAALEELEQQLFYGVTNEAAGFPGLKAFTPFGGDYTHNATGTTANTATSIYGVRFGEDYASLIYGEGDPLNLGEFREQDILGANNKPMPGEVADLMGWMGLQIKHKASVLRICNITADSGKTATDDLILTALDKLPTGMKPDVLFMSKRSRLQIRNSRSTPEVKVASLPTEVDGIPIIVTDAILNTDAIEA